MRSRRNERAFALLLTIVMTGSLCTGIEAAAKEVEQAGNTFIEETAEQDEKLTERTAEAEETEETEEAKEKEEAEETEEENKKEEAGEAETEENIDTNAEEKEVESPVYRSGQMNNIREAKQETEENEDTAVDEKRMKSRASDVVIDEKNFPDANFRSYIKESVDADKNGSLSADELNKTINLWLCEKNISSLKGLEYFTELKVLDCNSNSLNSLDVSGNITLESLSCFNNKLSDLDVSKNPELAVLLCGKNNLSSLDISKNPGLENLECGGNNLSSLDISKNPRLKNLNCDINNISKLDVSKNSALSSLFCNDNNISKLDVSKNSALLSLSCNDNNISSLDVGEKAGLVSLDCYNNNISKLEVSKSTALQRLCCQNNNLSSLDVSKNSALSYLFCSDNNISSLDVSKNPGLKDLYCYNNNISKLEVSKNTALRELNCQNNNLSSLDVSKNSALLSLFCGDNNISSLDVSKNTALEVLDCDRNNLASLDLSRNTVLNVNTFHYGGSITVIPTIKNGKCIVDLSKVILSDMLGRVNVYSGKYDASTGIWVLPVDAIENGAEYSFNTNSSKNNIMDIRVLMKHTHSYKNTVTKATPSKNGKIVKKCACGATNGTTIIYAPKTMTLSTTKYTYNGKVKKPSVKIKDNKGKVISPSNYKVTYSSGRKKVGRYTVKVTFKGNYSRSMSETFDIVPKSTSLSKVTAARKAFSVKWKKQSSQTSGYQVQYSTNSKFKKGNKAVTITKNKTTSRKISKVKARKKFYVRVRTYKNVKVGKKTVKLYSGWSRAKSVKTK